MNFRHFALWLLMATFAVPALAQSQAKAAAGIAKQFPDRFKASAS
jgi:hypothetical protein